MCIHTTLVKLQKDLKVPKDNTNNFGGYNYRSCEDIVEAVKKLLPDGTALILTDKMINLGDRYYVEATAKLCDKTSSIEAVGYAREAASRKGFGEDQLTGAASSYARKYALNGLLAIDDTKDSDTNESQKINKEAEEKAKKEDERREAVRQNISRNISALQSLTTPEAVAKFVQDNPIPGLSVEQAKFYDSKIKEITAKMKEPA